VINWLKKYLKKITAETYTFCGLAIAYFTLEGSAKKVTGLITAISFVVWLVTIPLRDEDED
jgi:hypothetical protein